MMRNKKGIIMGMANKFSIAYGIAETLRNSGAELVFTVANDYFKSKISSIIAEDFPDAQVFVCDVSNAGDVEKTFSNIRDLCGSVDFIVHSIAFSDKNELKGKFIDTTRENFLTTMNISCYSFIDVCKHSPQVLKESGGSVLTLSYYGAEKVFPNYNVMAVAKAALETSVMYAAHDLGSKKIRVNAISAGPIKTLAASGVGGFSKIVEYNRQISPLGRNVTLKDIGGAAVFLLSELGSGVTGEILYVDCGCNVMGMKIPE
jgi:enoyl-[acyl-carrier protein] reductase I